MSAAVRWQGGQVLANAYCLLAPNPGPMTLDGTNSWVLAVPGGRSALVVDPGPLDEAHLTTLAALATTGGRRVAAVLLTHGHHDHSAGARRFAELTGAPVRALDPAHRLGEAGLAGGDVVAADGLELRVLATPGHTADSLSFVLPGAENGPTAILTGDTVLGRGTTVVAHPDGRLGPYLDSLRLLRDLPEIGAGAWVLPGHGPALADGHTAIEGYLTHRAERLAQVAAAVAAGAGTAREVVERVYAEVDPVLWPAAELSVRAQLEYLGGRRG